MDAPHPLLDRTMIVLAVLLGAGSIVLFALGDFFHFVPLGLSERSALMWDGGLSLLFFIQHSGMVRRGFRARLTRIVPQRYEGAVYSIASGVALTIVVVFWQPTERRLITITGPLRWIMIAAALGAVAVFVWTSRAAESFDLLGIRPIRAHLRGSTPRPSRFLARGPYGWVRHPLYSCVLVLLWCAPVITSDRLLLNVLWSAWVIVGARLEERDLIADFGDVYRDYRRRVPMLIPWRGRVRLDGLAASA